MRRHGIKLVGLAMAPMLGACTVGVRFGPAVTVDTAGSPGIQGLVQLNVGPVITRQSSAVVVHTGAGVGVKEEAGVGAALATNISYDAYPHRERPIGYRAGVAGRMLLSDPIAGGLGVGGGIIVPITSVDGKNHFTDGFLFTPEVEALFNLGPDQPLMTFVLAPMFGWQFLFDMQAWEPSFN